jgi:hypothetical protein
VPNKVRIIAGPRNTDFDGYIEKLVSERGYGVEREYFGIPTEERASEVRRRFRQAGRHLGVAVKAYWTTCTGCEQGGKSCAAHVHFSAYPPEAARRYMEGKAKKRPLR